MTIIYTLTRLLFAYSHMVIIFHTLMFINVRSHGLYLLSLIFCHFIFCTPSCLLLANALFFTYSHSFFAHSQGFYKHTLKIIIAHHHFFFVHSHDNSIFFTFSCLLFALSHVYFLHTLIIIVAHSHHF